MSSRKATSSPRCARRTRSPSVEGELSSMRVTLLYGRPDAGRVGKMRFFNWRKLRRHATFHPPDTRCRPPSAPGRSPPMKMHLKTCPVNRLNTFLATGLLGSALLFGGCADRTEDELTKGVVSGERPVAMEGSDSFFGGKVMAKITVSRGVGKGLKPGKRSWSGETSTYDAYAHSEGKMTLGSPLPPVTLHLVLSNPGPDAIT